MRLSSCEPDKCADQLALMVWPSEVQSDLITASYVPDRAPPPVGVPDAAARSGQQVGREQSLLRCIPLGQRDERSVTPRRRSDETARTRCDRAVWIARRKRRP